jgi:hypothetical protein
MCGDTGYSQTTVINTKAISKIVNNFFARFRKNNWPTSVAGFGRNYLPIPRNGEPGRTLRSAHEYPRPTGLLTPPKTAFYDALTQLGRRHRPATVLPMAAQTIRAGDLTYHPGL